MPPSDIAVSARGVSKSYNIAIGAHHTTAADAISDVIKNPRKRPKTETFWALQDIDFDVHKGDVVGIIGRNGAGKSTLLKILSRIVEPTTGQIDIYGRVGSLLEVGTGFHPELTGRENIYLNGAMLGMSRREITSHFADIVEFSEIGKFLDTPVKRYSSGMYVRLAFAVAAHLTPEILIVDEVLAVGDAQFQKKCLGKMKDVAQQEGRTVLFVSHQIPAVQKLCNRVLVFTKGRLVYQGEVEGGVSAYIEQATPSSDLDAVDLRPREDRGGDGLIRFTALHVLHDRPTQSNEFLLGEKIGLQIAMWCDKPVADVCVGYSILDLHGTVLFSSHHDDTLGLSDLPAGETVLESWIDPNYLQPGRYIVQLGVLASGLLRDFVTDVAQVEVAGVLGSENAKLDQRPGIMRIDFPWRLAASSFHNDASAEWPLRVSEVNNA